MKPDERRLLDLMKKTVGVAGHRIDHRSPRELFQAQAFLELDIPIKRAHYLLFKWTNKGWYNYGVTVDLGWMTAEGMAA